MDESIKTWTLRFPAKENPDTEKALFDWPIVLQYDVKAKYALISRIFREWSFFTPSVRLTNQKPRAFVAVRSTDEIALFPFVCCFCFVRAFSFQGHTKTALPLNILWCCLVWEIKDWGSNKFFYFFFDLSWSACGFAYLLLGSLRAFKALIKRRTVNWFNKGWLSCGQQVWITNDHRALGHKEQTVSHTLKCNGLTLTCNFASCCGHIWLRVGLQQQTLALRT